MASKKKVKAKSPFNKPFLILGSVILVILVVAVLYKYSILSGQHASPNSTPINSQIEWKSYTLPNEKLSFKYPQNWKVDQIKGQKQDYDSVAVYNGRYIIDFLVYKSTQPIYPMAGSLNDWTPIDSFILNNQTVYLLNEGGDGSNGSGGMTLSSCKSNTKCLVKAKNVPGYIDIMSLYVEGKSGDVAPGTIQTNDPNLKVIKEIIESINYN